MFSRRPENQPSPTSQFEQWDAVDYITLLTNPEFRNESSLQNLLSANFFAFAAEYTRGELISTFEMTVDPVKGLLGITSSYKEGMEGMGENFETKLVSQSKVSARAEVESNNISKLNEWSKAAPIDSFFVWNSPPGKVSEGYAGLNSHSFIFIYQKTSKNTVVLHQLRTWMNLSQHESFLNGLATNTQNDTDLSEFKNPSHKVIHNIRIFQPKDIGCANGTEVVTKLTEMAYQTQDSWKTKPQEMPKVPDSEYAQFRDFLLSLYMRIVVPTLLAEVPETNSAESNEWQQFIRSPKYALLVKKLDLTFGLLAYQPLVRWVEEKDENKRSSLFSHLFRKKNMEITQLSFAEIEHKLLSLFELQMQKTTGQAISKKDAKEYNSIAASLLSSTARGLSLGQCGLGTFIPTRMFQTLGLQQLTGSSLTPGVLLGLPTKEKASALSFLAAKKYLPLQLANGETWYVLAQHHELYANYFAQNPLSFAEDGTPIGPCGWLLRGDERGLDELVLTFSEFAQLEQLKASLLADLLNNPEGTVSLLHSSLLPMAKTPSQKEKVLEVLQTLQDSLKSAVSLQELLFSDFFSLTAWPLIAKLSKKVDMRQFVTNPEYTATQVVTVFDAVITAE